MQAGDGKSQINVEQTKDMILINIKNITDGEWFPVDDLHYIRDKIQETIKPYVNKDLPVVIFQRLHHKNQTSIDNTVNILVVHRDKTIVTIEVMPDKPSDNQIDFPDMTTKQAKTVLKKVGIKL